jgi:D-alanyl-D-alanine carboxypeptidase
MRHQTSRPSLAGSLWHNGEIPGFNTYLFYHPQLDAVVVEVNSDISSSNCPKETPTLMGSPKGISCDLPVDRIFRALAVALGEPAPSPPTQ